MIPERIPIAYSIWFIPSGEKFLLLKNIIIELSQFFEGIKFIPHVTLMSNLDYDEKTLTKEIGIMAKKIRPFNVYFNQIEYLDEFFQSLFINIKINNDLTRARKTALFSFPHMNEKYNPHLSLAYGNVKSEIKKNLKNKIYCPVKKFKVRELYLVHNDEINLKWEVINKFALK